LLGQYLQWLTEWASPSSICHEKMDSVRVVPNLAPGLNEPNRCEPTAPRPRTLWPEQGAYTGRPGQIIGRSAILQEMTASALSSFSPGRRVAVAICGPRGAGTSTMAAHLTNSVKRYGNVQVLRVDASTCRGPHAILTILIQCYHPNLAAHGYSVPVLSTFLLRNMRTSGRPTVVWLDQVHMNNVDVSSVAMPLLSPEKYLPEGAAGVPPIMVVTSGCQDPLPNHCRGPATVLHYPVPLLSGRDFVQAMESIAASTLGEVPPMNALMAVGAIVTSRGWGLSMVGRVLEDASKRAHARGAQRIDTQDVTLPAGVIRDGRTQRNPARLDSQILSALRDVQHAVSVHRISSAIEKACIKDGLPVPSPSQIRRHIVHLEQLGVVQRIVRCGGNGGSRSLVAPSIIAQD
jgi:hypothetical protein